MDAAFRRSIYMQRPGYTLFGGMDFTSVSRQLVAGEVADARGWVVPQLHVTAVVEDASSTWVQ